MSASPTCSVIVPVYKCEPYIDDCIESLRQQTLTDFEAICVNDASPDRSLEKAQRAAQGDARFRFLQMEKNSGLSAVRNRGIDEATGRIIVLLDSDDLLTPDALARIAQRFDEQQLDTVYFNAESFYEDAAAYKCVVEDFSGRDSFDDVATGRELFTFFEKRDQFFPHGALQAMSRRFLNDNHLRFKEGILHEDVLLTFQMILAAQRTSFLNEPLYRRRIHTGSIMAAPRRTMRNITGHLIAIHFMKDYLLAHAETEDERFVRAMAHRLDAYLKLCAEDWLHDITSDEKQAYLASISPADRVRFELEVAQPAELLREIYDCHTWRVGAALLKAPQAARDAVNRLRRTR